MKQHVIRLCFLFCLSAISFQAMALTDTYFATGEDLDYLIESDNTLAIQEIEYTLRRFVLFRKVEDYLFNLNNEYLGDEE